MTREEAMRAAARLCPAVVVPEEPSKAERVLRVLANGPKTYRQVAVALDISRNSANGMLSRMVAAGQIRIAHLGRPGKTNDPTLYALLETKPTP